MAVYGSAKKTSEMGRLKFHHSRRRELRGEGGTASEQSAVEKSAGISGPKNLQSLSEPDSAAVQRIGGIKVSRVTRQGLADLMIDDVALARTGQLAEPKFITSANGAVIVLYHSSPSFREMIDEADLVDVDGMPLVITTRFKWSSPLPERVATTDFIEDACAAAAANGTRFYFLGAKPGVAEQAAKRLQTKYPGLDICGVRNGFFDESDIPAICADIRSKKTDVLWLGLGSPKQEEFAVKYRAMLSGVAWIRTCGGLFDHASGMVPRAPNWMQVCGLEWLYRTFHEPLRLGKRYIHTNPVAIWYLLTQTHD